ncbi:hypothetical protein L9F63_024478, partial [Diploptera punctata]
VELRQYETSELADEGLSETSTSDSNEKPDASTAFILEAKTYMNIHSPMSDTLKENIPDYKPFAPKFVYLYQKQPINAIVIEDLKKDKFCLANVRLGLDLKHCQLVMSKIAQYHASSVVLLTITSDTGEVQDMSDDEVLYDMLLKTRKLRKIRERPDHIERYDEEEFFVRFRLGKDSVIFIHDMIRHKLQHKTQRNHAISSMAQLLLTLRYYACGNFLICMGDFCGIDKGTTSRIIRRVSEAIAGLGRTFIRLPETEEEISQVQQGFYEIASFPKVIGALDCTHVKISSPGGPNAEEYRGRKGYFSINVQTVCDAQLKILDIVSRWQGSTHDQTIFNNSALKAQFERGQMGNSVLLGDSGYAMKNTVVSW